MGIFQQKSALPRAQLTSHPLSHADRKIQNAPHNNRLLNFVRRCLDKIIVIFLTYRDL